MEEDPLAKDPSAKPENYSSTETEEKEPEEKKPEKIPEKKKEAVESNNSNNGDKKVDFVAPIILSCLTFWLCGILFGGVAFILAVIGKYKADSGNQATAGRLKISSLVLSIVGIVIGLAAVVAFLVLYDWKKQTPIHG